MRKVLCCLLLGVVVLTGCKSTARSTSTPAAPAHEVAPPAYPGSKSAAPLDSGQANPAYPASQGVNPAYPKPGGDTGAAPAVNEYAPTAADEGLDRGNAFVEIASSSVVVLESAPVQVKIHLKGNLPNPCYQLRVNPSQPDSQKRIQVEAYSVVEPGKMCTEVLQEFDVEIPLGSFPSGHYSIYINEELLGEFDS